jgi:hypothetical protein
VHTRHPHTGCLSCKFRRRVLQVNRCKCLLGTIAGGRWSDGDDGRGATTSSTHTSTVHALAITGPIVRNTTCGPLCKPRYNANGALDDLTRSPSRARPGHTSDVADGIVRVTASLSCLLWGYRSAPIVFADACMPCTGEIQGRVPPPPVRYSYLKHIWRKIRLQLNHQHRRMFPPHHKDDRSSSNPKQYYRSLCLRIDLTWCRLRRQVRAEHHCTSCLYKRSLGGRFVSLLSLSSSSTHAGAL